jgi:multidrug resistance efflux pump
MPRELNQQLLRVGELLQLCARAREATREELPFVIVNETIQMVPYDQAVLWDVRSGRIAALSGAERVEPTAPYVLALSRLYRLVAAAGKRDTAHSPDAETLARARFDREAPLAPYPLWWPLRLQGQTVAVLMLARRDPWTEADTPLLEALGGAYAEGWELGRARRAPFRRSGIRLVRRLGIVAVVATLIGISFFPIRSSAIAPAEVVAHSPAFVRAPFAGVVDRIEIAPNAPVRVGQVLVRLERRELDAAMAMATKAFDVATAQYRQATQEAITDPRAREQLAALRGRLDEARADYEYRRTLLQRADIPSPADGIAVFNDAAEWIGRPVETGERIMQVSPPASSRIEVELPAADVAAFADGSEVLFFNNIAPDKPVAGHVVFMSYATSLSPTGVLIYTVRADLESGNELRLGLKGTAKIFGPPRPLILQVFRRPIAFIRELLA